MPLFRRNRRDLHAEAQIEIKARQRKSSTYTEPLVGTSSRQQTEIARFLDNFYQKAVFQHPFKALLEACPVVQAHYDTLVPDVVSFDQFWARYLYRCSLAAVLAEWHQQEVDRLRARKHLNVSNIKNAFLKNEIEKGLSGTSTTTSDSADGGTAGNKSCSMKSPSSKGTDSNQAERNTTTTTTPSIRMVDSVGPKSYGVNERMQLSSLQQGLLKHEKELTAITKDETSSSLLSIASTTLVDPTMPIVKIVENASSPSSYQATTNEHTATHFNHLSSLQKSLLKHEIEKGLAGGAETEDETSSSSLASFALKETALVETTHRSSTTTPYIKVIESASPNSKGQSTANESCRSDGNEEIQQANKQGGYFTSVLSGWHRDGTRVTPPPPSSSLTREIEKGLASMDNSRKSLESIECFVTLEETMEKTTIGANGETVEATSDGEDGSFDCSSTLLAGEHTPTATETKEESMRFVH